MNKELLKKYKAEFDAWIEGESLLYKTTTKDVWVQANNIDVSGLFSNPSHYIKAIVIDDPYVIYRKALAEGKTIQHISYTTGEWVDFNKGFEPTASYTFLSPPEYYRIKPEEPQFKVGDWVVNKTSKQRIIKKVTSVTNGDTVTVGDKEVGINVMLISDLELWQPKNGEWCWFWDEDKQPFIAQFDFMETEDNDTYYYTIQGLHGSYADLSDATYSFQYCEPFIGQLPTILKDNT